MPGSLTAGDRLGAYLIEEVIGFGGMGIVYRARHEILDRIVAVKVLPPHLSGDAGFRDRFRREARISASFEHPNIATIYDTGEIDGTLFMAMELVEGEPLSALIGSPTLTPSRSLTLLAPIADALDAAHAAGLVHRDIKPTNILVGPGDRPYLVDFGITKTLGHMTMTSVGGVLGSLGYVSPEQISGKPVGPQSDIYSLTVVLFECLTGKTPFQRESDTAVMYAHLEDQPPSISSMAAGLPPPLDEIVETGMAKDPAERFETATALIAATRAVFDAADAAAVEAPAEDAAPEAAQTPVADRADRPRPPTAAARRRRLVLLAVPVAAAAAGVAIGLATRSEDAPAQPDAVLSTEHLALTYAPSDWRRPPAKVAVGDLDAAGAQGLLYRPLDGRGVLAAGTLATAGAALPAGLSGRFTSAPRRQAVRLGALQAARYEGKADRGASYVRAFLVPTTAGTQVIACQAPAGDFAALSAACDGVAGSVHLRGADGLPVDPSPGYAHSLRDALGPVARLRRHELSQLGSRFTHRRARAARRLGAAQRRAARAIERIDAPAALGAANAAVAAALKRQAGALERLAVAARDRRYAAYARATRAVRAAQRTLDRRLAVIRRAGYPDSR